MMLTTTLRKHARKYYLSTRYHLLKLVLLTFYVILSPGCGKQGKNQKSSEETQSSQTIESNSLEILARNEKLLNSIVLKEHGWVKIPPYIFYELKSGSITNLDAYLLFNGSSENNFPISCHYSTNSLNNVTRLKLQSCYEIDILGSTYPISYEANEEIPIMRNEFIGLELDEPDKDVQIRVKAVLQISYL